VSAVKAGDEGQFRAPFRLTVGRLFWLPVGVAGILVAIVLGTLVVVSWHALARIEPVQTHLERIGGLQDLGLNMEQILFRGLRGKNRIVSGDLAALRESLGQAASQGQYLNPATPSRLGRIGELLANGEADPVEALFDALAELRRALAGERRHLDLLVTKVAYDTGTELDLSLVLVVVLPLVGVAALLALRGRVRRPLASLGDLLVRLAERDYRPVPEEAVTVSAAIMRPVLRSYNELVHRLQDLEAEHVDREHTLEQEVRRATEALLTQSRQLARSERLAAVGAVSAGLAHELRNPLAGIQMACAKLLRALGDGDQSARLAAVVAELKRLNRLLSERVDAARHAPETLRPVHLKDTVEQFLSLVRYQVPQRVRLNARIPEGLVCWLPEGGLRQALLNLVLNAAQSTEGGEGEVEIHAVREGAAVVLSVTDTGPGFPTEMLTVGIRPFASGRLGGTGLGLAMVRRFTEDINAQLGLDNLKPHGARVTLRFPCPEVTPAHQCRGASHA
jgi:two-component system NtrC family sensor kinase